MKYVLYLILNQLWVRRFSALRAVLITSYTVHASAVVDNLCKKKIFEKVIMTRVVDPDGVDPDPTLSSQKISESNPRMNNPGPDDDLIKYTLINVY